MKIKHSFSRWNTLITQKPYHNKPSKQEINKALANMNEKGRGILYRDNEIMIVVPNELIEVRSRCTNSLTSNVYVDVWTFVDSEGAK